MRFLAVILYLLVLVQPAHADDDFETLVKKVAPYVSDLTEPVVMYNWHRAKSESELNQNSQDRETLAGVQTFIGRYWDHQPDPRTAGMGDGLYLALDPVVTRGSYGGGPKEWILTEVRLPKNFRVLDAHREGHQPMSQDDVQMMNRLGCPMAERDEPLGRALVTPKNNSDNPKCAAVIKRLLKDRLNVDGLLYGYDASFFKECNTSDPFRQSALVVMSGEKLRPEDLRVFNHTTTNDEAERIRIQSFFTKARLDRGAGLAPSTPPATLTAGGEDVLLWSDIAGKPYDASLPDWIQKNIFACGKSPQMKPIGSAPMPAPPDVGTGAVPER